MVDGVPGIARGVAWSAPALLIDATGPGGALFAPLPLSECLYEAGLLPPDKLGDLVIVEWRPKHAQPFIFVGSEFATLSAMQHRAPAPRSLGLRLRQRVAEPAI